MAKSYGTPAAPPKRVEPAPQPTTSAGLVEISKRDGWLAAMATAAEATIATGIASDVTSIEAPDGTRYARLTRDVPRDPRTYKQQMADQAWRWHLEEKLK